MLPVTVDGWDGPVYLDPQATRAAQRSTPGPSLSPFDPIVWERTRTERLFDFRYRIEIYTPAEKREFGYYCLPFLLGETIVARARSQGRPGNGPAVWCTRSIRKPRTPAESRAGTLATSCAAWRRGSTGRVRGRPKPWAKRLLDV